MKTYRIKYSVEFEEDTGKYMTMTRRGEMSVEDGTAYYYENDKGGFKDAVIVKDEDTASQYVRTVFDDNVSLLVDIPEELIEEGLEYDKHFYITNVISIQKQ